jgi:hypothetical protein
MDDDRFVVQPIAGIESNTSQDVLVPPVFDRDYPREHSRRMLTMDFRPLLDAATASPTTPTATARSTKTTSRSVRPSPIRSPAASPAKRRVFVKAAWLKSTAQSVAA